MKQVVVPRLDAATPLIRKMQPFRSRHGCYAHGTPGNLTIEPNVWADRFETYHPDSAFLPARYEDSYQSSTYAVFSYKTPIAWFATIPHDIDDAVAWITGETQGQWILPLNVKYSVTTNRHQSLVHGALEGWGGRTWGLREDGTWGCTNEGETGPALPYSRGWGDEIRVGCGEGRAYTS